MLPSVTSSPIAAFDARFSAVMVALGLHHHESYVTALSGGADSTGLALLVQRYANAKRKKHHAVIVNHGLRDCAFDEALRVQSRLQKHGVVSKIISVSGPRPKSAVQEWARINRYRILISAAREQNAVLLFAHHTDDQAETVAMRLLKGSGLVGLAGIPVLRSQHGVTIARPVLCWSHAQLRDFCVLLNCSVECDLSNKDRQFERVRIRQLLAIFDQRLIGPSSSQIRRLAASAAKLTSAADDANVNDLSGAVKWYSTGYVRVTMADLNGLPDFRWKLAMRRMVMAVSGVAYAPSSLALDRVRRRVSAGLSATVGGCHFSPIRALAKTGRNAADSHRVYHLFREIGRHVKITRICSGDEVVFAGCWLVKSKQAGFLHAFGDVGKLSNDIRLGNLAKNLPDSWLLIPFRARQTIPVLTTLDGRLIYPQIQEQGFQGSIEAVEARFLGRSKGSTLLNDKLIGQIL